ncbi:MAG: DUF6282 family protein [Bacillota bacterium]
MVIRAEQYLRGAVDMHIHCNPDTKERLMDGYQVARQARDAGMKAIVLKDHHTVSSDRARMITAVVDGIEVYGGITLNSSVGGLNPSAVESAIKLGAKVVWLPTVNAASNMKSKSKPYSNGISVFKGGLDSPGEVRPEVAEICKLVADAGIILATGHISSVEVMAVLDVARKTGLDRVLVNHPQNRCVGMGPSAQKEAAEKGAYLEQCFNFCTPHLPLLKADDLAAGIREVGPSRCVMATDMGQVDNFTPAEGLRVFIQMMLDRGITADEIRTMVSAIPARLLDC